MEEKTIKNTEQTVNDLLDRAFVCAADSPDYEKLLDRAAVLQKALLEDKRIDAEKEIELKKIEQSGKITQKDVFVVGVPIGAAAVGYLYKSHDWDKKSALMWERELNGNLTFTAGKSLWREYLSLFNFAGRKH